MNRRNVILVSLVSFFSGVLATAAIASYAFGESFVQARANQAYVAASRAQFEARQLSALRKGDAETVIVQLESMLTSLTLQLSDYENVVPVPLRDPLIYSSMAEVREYREAHPVDYDRYGISRDIHEKALNLGAKATPAASAPK